MTWGRFKNRHQRSKTIADDFRRSADRRRPSAANFHQFQVPTIKFYPIYQVSPAQYFFVTHNDRFSSP